MPDDTERYKTQQDPQNPFAIVEKPYPSSAKDATFFAVSLPVNDQFHILRSTTEMQAPSLNADQSP